MALSGYKADSLCLVQIPAEDYLQVYPHKTQHFTLCPL
jgi:hypothetical protein